MGPKLLEIERRWLLRGLPGKKILKARSTKYAISVTIYILNDPDLEVRVRKNQDAQGVTYPVVMKLGSGLVRLESPKLLGDDILFEYYYPRGYPHLKKNHWDIFLPFGQKLEISQFLVPARIHGLVLAEMEFESRKAAMRFNIKKLPAKIRELIVKEVTDDSRYNGKNLAFPGRHDLV